MGFRNAVEFKPAIVLLIMECFRASVRNGWCSFYALKGGEEVWQEE